MKRPQVIIRNKEGRIITLNNRSRRTILAELKRTIPRRHRKIHRRKDGTVHENPFRSELRRG